MAKEKAKKVKKVCHKCHKTYELKEGSDPYLCSAWKE